MQSKFESFKAAFAFIRSLTKTAAAVTKYAASWWVDSAQQWCRDFGVQGVIRSLLPAIGACGDVQYSLDDRSAFWLDSYRASIGHRLAGTHRCAREISWTAELDIPVKILQDSNEGRIESHRKPMGVVGSITPWNFRS
jgi:hypothetical protein